MSMQSRHFKAALTEEVSVLGGEPVTDGTTNSGKVYRVWMDIKAAFSSDDATSSLEQCEYGEDAAQKAYDVVLNEDDITGDVHLLVENQKKSLREAHDRIRDLRDGEPSS